MIFKTESVIFAIVNVQIAWSSACYNQVNILWHAFSEIKLSLLFEIPIFFV